VRESGPTKANFGQVLTRDVNDFKPFEVFPDLEVGELDLLAGGVPCPPFSLAGKQLGHEDERDLFPRMLDLVEELKPRAVLIENVRGLLEPEEKFAPYRAHLLDRLDAAGYAYCGWRVLEAADFGVPQLRPRALLVMIRKDCYRGFEWPEEQPVQTTVFQALDASMRERFGMDHEAPWLVTREGDFRDAAKARYAVWCEKAQLAASVAPTLVGGSKKHGGADLGPTRAKAAWAAQGVNGLGVANDKHKPDVERDLLRETGPMITVEQAAIIQGLPQGWIFTGGKTAQYRQIGNAFPPPVAAAVGRCIAAALALTGPLNAPPVLPHHEKAVPEQRKTAVKRGGRPQVEAAGMDLPALLLEPVR
jgi:DNA (cytosine-5)-methyltransferase 1